MVGFDGEFPGPLAAAADLQQLNGMLAFKLLLIFCQMNLHWLMTIFNRSESCRHLTSHTCWNNLQWRKIPIPDGLCITLIVVFTNSESWVAIQIKYLWKRSSCLFKLLLYYNLWNKENFWTCLIWPRRVACEPHHCYSNTILKIST